MDPTVIALFVQVVDTAATFAFEGVKRKSTKDNHRLFESLRTLNVEQILTAQDGVLLASKMAGGLTAKTVAAVLSEKRVVPLVRNVLFATIVQDQEENLSIAEDSLRRHLSSKFSPLCGNEAAEELSEHITERFVAYADAIVVALQKSDPSLLVQFQQMTILKRISSVLDNINAQHDAVIRASSADFSEKSEKFLKEYRKAAAERHGYITPPDFETNRKIAIEQLYVPPRIHFAPDEAATIDMEHFLRAVDRTVILGDPGGGKSTLSAFITTRAANDPKGKLPFHVTLRHFAAHSERLSLLDFIEHELKPRYQINPVPNLIEDLLIAGEAIVIFDGLDELIDAGARREVTRSVELFSLKYPHTPVLVTSRRIGYDQARLDPAIFSAFTIGGFESTQVDEYVQKWFDSQDEFSAKEASELSAAFVEQSMAVLDLRSNPLMLALMCIIFRGENYIPRNRPAVYEKCATLLFEKWDGHRKIEVPLQARDHVNAAMKFLAYSFMKDGTGDSGVKRGVVIQMLAEYLQPRAVESKDAALHAAEEFVDYCAGRAWVFTDAGTTAAGEPIFTFTHRTFMEYFAAVHLTRVHDTPEKLARSLLPYIAREEWDVVAQLAVQQVDSSADGGSARALTTMLADKVRRTRDNRDNILFFVARCMSFAVVPPPLVRQIARECLVNALPREGERGQFADHLTPLTALKSVSHGLDAVYASDEVLECCRDLLLKDDHVEFVLLLVLNWLTTEAVNEMLGFFVSEPWLKVAKVLGDITRERIRMDFPTASAAFVLGWHGVLPFRDVVDWVDGLQPNFCARYVVDPTPGDRGRVGRMLGELIFTAAESNPQNYSEAKREYLTDFCFKISDDLGSLERVIPDDVIANRGEQTGFIRYSPEDLYYLPPVVVDAAVILSIAYVEVFVTMNEYRRYLHIGSYKQEWLDQETGEIIKSIRESASTETRDLLRSWLDGEAKLFENARSAEPELIMPNGRIVPKSKVVRVPRR